MEKKYDYQTKILLLGDSGVGKTCLLLRFCDDFFTPSLVATMGIDLKIKHVNLDNRTWKVQIWDTAGQERFRTLTRAYYKGAQGLLLVYDVTDETSFTNVRRWIRNIELHANQDVPIVLVGNKSDLGKDRVVSVERGKALAAECDLPFFETSAKSNVEVTKAFHALLGLIKKQMEKALFPEKETEKPIVLTPMTQEKIDTHCSACKTS